MTAAPSQHNLVDELIEVLAESERDQDPQPKRIELHPETYRRFLAHAETRCRVQMAHGGAPAHLMGVAVVADPTVPKDALRWVPAEVGA